MSCIICLVATLAGNNRRGSYNVLDHVNEAFYANDPQAIASQEVSHSAEHGRVVERSSDGLFYIQADINGRFVRFLLDTGATVTLLRAEDAKSIGAFDKLNFDRQAKTASGYSSIAWIKLTEVQLAGRTFRDLPVAVAREGLPVSLLGQNVLTQMGLITIEGNTLKLGGTEYSEGLSFRHLAL